MTINEDLWEFPHEMTLKVMGSADSPLEQAVVAILSQHLEDFDPNAHLSVKPSAKGNYISVNARITVQHRDHVTNIYAELNACNHVKVVF
jgi:putative lipoic acid-binding regulatory protein